MSLINSWAVGLSLESARKMPGKNEITDKIPTTNGASILIIVALCKRNHEATLMILTINPKKINKLKL